MAAGTAGLFERVRSRLGRWKMVAMIGVVVVSVGMVVVLRELRLSQAIHRQYRLLAEGMVKKGEAALQARAYVLARRYFDRALSCAERGGFLRRSDIERRIKEVLNGDENLQRVGRGLVLLGNSWIERSEFSSLFKRSQEAKGELRTHLSRATIAFAEGDYEEAVKHYESAQRVFDEAFRFGAPEVQWEVITQSYNKALLLLAKRRADEFARERAFDRAGEEYKRALDIAHEIKGGDVVLFEQLHHRTVQMFLQAARVCVQSERFEDARSLLKRAQHALYGSSYLPAESVTVYEKQIQEVYRDLEMMVVQRLRDVAQTLAKSRSTEQIQTGVDDAASLLRSSSSDKGDEFVASLQECAQKVGVSPSQEPQAGEVDELHIVQRRYGGSRCILQGAVMLLQTGDMSNDPKVRSLVGSLQKDLEVLAKAEEGEYAARNRLWDQVVSTMKTAKAWEDAGRYDDAVALYNETIKAIMGSGFRQEARFVAKLEELRVRSDRAAIQKVVSAIERSLGVVEERFLEGKLDEVVELSHAVVVQGRNRFQGGDTRGERAIRRVAWLGEVAAHMATVFSEAVRLQALEFFQRQRGAKVSVKVSDATCGKIVVVGGNMRDQCVTFHIHGRANIYLEVERRMSAHPLLCEAKFRLCEGSLNAEHYGSRCREAKVRSTIGPEPFSFGEVK